MSSSSSSSSKEKSIQDSRRAERAPNHSPSNRKSPKQRRFVGIAPATAARKSPSQNEARAARFSQKPSQRLNPKTIDPFNEKKKAKTMFSVIYSSGGIPCRLVHGSVKHKLHWDIDPETIVFDPLLITLAEGLRETDHPYPFVAREAFRDLLKTSDADVKAKPLLEKIIAPLRACLISSKADVFRAGLTALCQLSDSVRESLNPHLKSLLSPISKRMLEKDMRDCVASTLQQLEVNGGKDALAVIKLKIPTYSSIASW
ncbi:PACRG-like protein [Oscarella lobularis]|uniref:PACRG-like protein n=1 Tax=Oscarella lobularis TaxID=121494 RepID=UPI0033139265